MSDPFEYVPDEEPGDDDRALYADAAAELAEWERIDAASHAPPCHTMVDGRPCGRNLGHWGNHG